MYYKTLLMIAVNQWFRNELNECVKSDDKELATMRLNDFWAMMKLIENFKEEQQ